MERRSFFKLFAAAPVAVAGAVGLTKIAQAGARRFSSTGSCHNNVAPNPPGHTHSVGQGGEHSHGLCPGCFVMAIPEDPRYPMGPARAVLSCDRGIPRSRCHCVGTSSHALETS